MKTYEIEIKSLLGKNENAENLITRIHKNDPKATLQEESNQLNHYFVGSALAVLARELHHSLSPSDKDLLTEIQNNSIEHSIRTRKNNNDVYLILKGKADQTTSANGTARIELEVRTDGYSLEELDTILVKTGYTYQAKWSRYRRQYVYKDMTLCIDKNAGYGYVAEFEKITTDKGLLEQTKESIRQEMRALQVEELSQDRLQRMFEHYNANWQDYYGTDKIFTIY